MQQPTTPPSSDGQKGIGWHLSEIDGTNVVSHGGSTSGHQSALELVPEHDFALVIMTNARHGLELITDVKRWVFDTYLGLSEPEPEPLDLTPDQLEAFAGVYESHTGAINVEVVEDYLVGKLSVNPEVEIDFEEPEMPIRILPNDQLLIIDGQYRGLKGGIERDSSGRVTALNLGRIFTRRE
jgi:hypothetical protein